MNGKLHDQFTKQAESLSDRWQRLEAEGKWQPPSKHPFDYAAWLRDGIENDPWHRLCAEFQAGYWTYGGRLPRPWHTYRGRSL